MRKASLKYWHPDLILAVHKAIRTCRSCQLMSPPDPSLGDLRPIQPAPPLTPWGIDHTQIGSKILLNVVKYATGWLETRNVPNADFTNTVPLLLHIINTFGTPKQLISDNAGFFTGQEAQIFQAKFKIAVANTTPYRPRANGKVEQANGVLEGFLARTILDNKKLPQQLLLAQVVSIYNRRVSPTGYSPFLLFGTQLPATKILYPAYTREATDIGERQWSEEFTKLHQ
ncbi:hypothetical protein K3495_g8827 [Podosphaera aphanis]|nr:hypothetical protein K3495_g8827 [Podosphaera aphanis]